MAVEVTIQSNGSISLSDKEANLDQQNVLTDLENILNHNKSVSPRVFEPRKFTLDMYENMCKNF